jgi:hypothetical protein
VIATRALQIDVSRLSAADIELAYEGITTDLAVVSIVSIKAEPDISDAFGRLYRAFEDRDCAATEGAIAAAERECRAEGYIP